MLLQFTIENVQSFHRMSTLDMIATRIIDHQESLINTGDLEVLPVVTIYGANATGKTTFVLALRNMAWFIVNSMGMQFDQNILPSVPVIPFIFDVESTMSPSLYEIVFLIDGIEYRYGYIATANEIQQEYLEFKLPGKNKYNTIFLRIIENNISKVSVGRTKKVDSAEAEDIKTMNGIVSSTELLLTALGRKNRGVASRKSRYTSIYKWFMNISVLNPVGNSDQIGLSFSAQNYYLKNLYEDRIELEKQLNFVNKADRTITGFELEENKTNGITEYRVKTKHSTINKDGSVLLPVTVESAGTRNMISIYPTLKRTLDSGSVLIADELDCNIHPLLLQEIISLFTNKKTNPNGAQLICTMHNVIIMNRQNLRRDEIWFADKNVQGESELYSLSDILVNDKKVRNDADYCRQYIMGQYGAIPVFE